MEAAGLVATRILSGNSPATMKQGRVSVAATLSPALFPLVPHGERETRALAFENRSLELAFARLAEGAPAAKAQGSTSKIQGRSSNRCLELSNRRLQRADAVANADDAGPDDFGQHTLALVLHKLTQAGTDGIHLSAGSPWFVEMENGATNCNLLPNQVNEIDAESFDIGAHDPGCYGFEAESGGVFGNLFPFNQGDLAAGWLAAGTAGPPEIAAVANDSFFSNYFEKLNLGQWCVRLGWMKMQGGDATGK